ncbi:GH39 family glycosyl hydrolase [Puia sp.]|jgi:xylan 1,4-beta-xylosidase|uniref:GH39 family glycosyl hydrolase n=1 Tax=Puia sp. TaxID=2045100 RepID=UPI002F41E821
MRRPFLAGLMTGAACCLMIATHAQKHSTPATAWIDKSLQAADEQYHYLMKQVPEGVMPRSFAHDSLRTCTSENWVAGFYPGTLLELYEATKDQSLYDEALRKLPLMDSQQYNTNTHDLGFMLNCSYGMLYRLKPDEKTKQLLLNAAHSLSTRFNPKVGCLRSWGKSNDTSSFRVIIDNMINLELLMWASKTTGDTSFSHIAVTHANTTMRNHFRPDYSSYHVVVYNPQTGAVMKKQTAQGAGDESAWARGQSWGLYGYTMMYRYTHDRRYLDQAQHIAAFLLNNPNLPADKIPYWDYNAPGIPNAERDASAGAVLASGLIELSRYSKGPLAKRYLGTADTILHSLASPAYTAPYGKNGGFLLEHSVANMNKNTEVNSPLPYADYYYVEALLRMKEITRGASAPRVISADFQQTAGPLDKSFAVCVGAGRAAEGLRADWQQQLAVAEKAIGFQYIRFHGLLCDEMHVYSLDKQGHIVYNFQYVDKLYDYLLSIGIRPFVELGFMPPDLASGTKTVFWWKGNVTPPKDYQKWADLIRTLVKHFETRYGRAEVEKWYFEVWNEPDLHGFWAGDQAEYFKLYKTTVEAIRSVSSTYRVGGPATSGSKWIREMLHYCDSSHLPLDFISTHSYNTKTVFDEYGVRKRTMLPSDYLWSNVVNTRRIMDSSGHRNLQLHYTEINSSPSSRDPLHDGYPNATFLLNTLKHTERVANSMSYWTFTDVFEEAGPGPTPFHGGFGLINLQGLRKPTFFAYHFLHELGGTELKNTDSCSWVCKSNKGVQALFWNLHLPFTDAPYFNDSIFRLNAPPAPAGIVTVKLDHIPNGHYRLSVYRVGYHHNDVFSGWLEMGSPADLSKQQQAKLDALANGDPESRESVTISDGRFTRRFETKENDIYFIQLERI